MLTLDARDELCFVFLLIDRPISAVSDIVSRRSNSFLRKSQPRWGLAWVQEDQA